MRHERQTVIYLAKRDDILWIRNCDIARQIEAPEKRGTKCCVYVLSDDPYPELT